MEKLSARKEGSDTEAAAAHAAAKELEVDPVVYHLGGGDDGAFRIGRFIEVHDDAL